MVTYLPTILMNIINQATNYITGDDKYSLVYTINITCTWGRVFGSGSWIYTI